MSKRVAKLTVVTLAAALFGNCSIASEKPALVHLRQPLTDAAQHCLGQILQTGKWRYSPDFHARMLAAAAFTEFDLNGPHRKDYLYMMTDFRFCGSAGCSMLIGEASKGGICREIYSGDGTEGAIEVLRKRDHGYRRLYTPCEIRFDGHEYRQIHWQCPRIDIQR